VLLLRRAFRLVGLAALFALAVWLVATGGQLFFYLPGLAAKTVAHTLSGRSDGPLATLFFLVFAACYVGAIGGVLVGLIQPFNRFRD
jgi:hypothetical protein